jgi:heat shock protein HtpX
VKGNLKVFVLMAGLTALLGALGQAFAGQGGLITALILAGVMNFIAYFASARIALRAYGARIVTAQEAPGLYGVIDRLRQRAGLPMPVVAISPHAQPNAFATGRSPSHAVVCVTQGLLDTVSPAELEGVLAHELAHIQHRDMLLMTATATLAAAVSHLAYVAMFMGGRDDEEGGNPIAALLMVVLAPIAAMLIQLAIGRQREFKADAGGAAISGQPLALASALKKLDAIAHQVPMRVEPAMAPLAQVNPLAAYSRGVVKLFSTHPPTAERVARLEQLAGALGEARSRS